MSETPKYGITEMEAAQSQPEIVVNEAIRVLEAMSQLRVLDKDVNVPPSSPDEGDTYIIPSGSTGDWSGFPFYIAVAVGGEWVYIPPKTGYIAYLVDEDLYYQFTSGSPSGWVEMDLGGTGGGGGGSATITVEDVSCPTQTFNGITKLQFVGNISVTQIDSVTVRIEVLP